VTYRDAPTAPVAAVHPRPRPTTRGGRHRGTPPPYLQLARRKARRQRLGLIAMGGLIAAFLVVAVLAVYVRLSQPFITPPASPSVGPVVAPRSEAPAAETGTAPVPPPLLRQHVDAPSAWTT
jgi:hypothetical protein